MMTKLQQRIFTFITQYVDAQQTSPSLTEIAQGIGLSPKSVSLISRNIHALVKAGKLAFHKHGYRNIQIVEPRGRALPILGRIAAGTPIEALVTHEFLDLSPLFASEHFLLEVKGDSMVEEGIFNGDFAICKHANLAQEGDIIAALIDQQETTLKRISYKIKDRITLIPANVALKPKAYLLNRVTIQGVFIGLLRLEKKGRFHNVTGAASG